MSEARGNDSTYSGVAKQVRVYDDNKTVFSDLLFFFLNLALTTGDRFAQQHKNSL